MYIFGTPSASREGMLDHVFSLVTSDGIILTEVVVTSDDIRECRPMFYGCTDSEIAHEIYEQRYESALAKVGHSYESAQSLGVYLDKRCTS